MTHDLRFSPFVALSEGSPSLEEITNTTTGSLDPLGISSIGNLCWNNAINSIGLVSGTVDDEIVPILRRLVASHLTDTTSKVLILYTNHSAVAGGSCSLLSPSWPPPRVLVSPQAPESIFSAYQTFNGSVTPISFPDTSLTLRHVLAIFTPPHDMPGSSTILGTVQYILSQLQEPFDLQRFGELVDGEKWSEEGATFIALRQTLLTKLLSPAGDEDPEDMARRITLVDLTDPVLNSTRLDSAIMDIAVHDFLRHSAERKMIILTNCQQYLMPTSTLRKTIESLATVGSGRTTSVILSTTDLTAISASPSFIHSFQYVLFGSSYSILHNGFLDKHFRHLPIPHEQCGFRRAVLWSPGSTLYLPKNEVPAKKSWNSLVSFIDVAEFEDFTPTAVLPNGTHNKVPDQQEPNHVEPVQHVTRLDSDDDGETSMSLGTPVPSNNELTSPAPSNVPLSQLTPARPKAPPSEAPSSPPAENATSSNKFEPLITAVLHLCEGELGILVDFEAVRKQVGRREEIQKLGWTTFTQYVKAACEKGLLEFTETGPNTKFLSLLAIETPAPVPLKGNTNNGLPDIVTDLPTGGQDDTRQSSAQISTQQYLPLIQEILSLSENRINHRLSLDRVLQHLEKTNTLAMEQFGWSSTESWILGASLEGYVAQEGTGKIRWVMATEKALQAVKNRDRQQGSTYNTETPPGSSTATPATKPDPSDFSSNDPHPSIKPKEVTSAAPNGTKPAEADDLRLLTRHRPVISTILRLTNDVRGKKVRLHDIVSALQLDYPRAKQEFLTELVDEAEKNGVLIREKDFFGIVWIYLAVPNPPAEPPPPPEPPAPQGPAPPPNTTNHSTPKNNDQVLNSGEPLKDAKCQIEISHYPLKYKPVIAALLKVTEGKLETKVRLSLIEHALRMEYPRAKHEFLHALILEAEEGGVLVREIGRADIGWVSLLPPGSGESATVGTSQPPPSPQPNDKWNPLSPTPHDTNPPRPNSLNPSPLPSAFRSPSPHNKTSSFSGPSPVTPNGMLSVQDYPSKHHAVVSALIKLTHGYRGVKVRMSDITKELQLVHHGETPCFPFSLITKAEADNILLRERDGSGMFWVSLRDPLPSEAIPSPPAKNATSSNKFEPLVSAVSHLCDGKRDILVDFEAVGKQLGEREEITQDMEQHKVVCETNSTSYRSKASSEELIGPGNAHSVAVPPPLPNEEERMMALGSVTLESRNMVSLEPPVLLANPPVNQEFIAELTPPSITPLTTAILNQSSVGSSNHDPYQPLISAILNVSENRPHAWVPFEAVKKVMGNVNELDWGMYTSMAKEAATKGIILLSERDSGEKSIKLLPEPESASATNAASIINECPEEFRLLVATVLKLGSNNVDAKVPFTAVGDIVGKTKAEVQALGYGWVSYPHWVQKAHETGWIQQGGFTEERWLMIGPKKTLLSESTEISTDLVAKTGPLSAPKSQTVTEPSQLLGNINSVNPNLGTSKDQAISQEVNAPVPSASSSVAVFPQSDQSSTTGTSEPLEHPLMSSPATSVDHAAIVSRTKNIDSKGPIFGTNNSSSTSFMFSGSSQTRRVSVDDYPPRHRRIVETMLTLCGGKSHIGITRRELFATLQGNTSVGAIQQTLSKLISKAMEEGVLEGFMDDQKEICFFLRNPVLTSTKKTSSKTWFPFMDVWR